MGDISELDQCYKRYITNIQEWIPEGVISVDLRLLQHFDLLHYHRKDSKDRALTRYFHVIETSEKITLVNDQFVIWIVPEKVNKIPITFTLIALNLEEGPRLEMAFSASGIYNSSRLVLRVLEKYLQEIQETEELLSKYQKKVG